MYVKFGLKIPNRLRKMSEKIRGWIFLTHAVGHAITSFERIGKIRHNIHGRLVDDTLPIGSTL